MTERRPSESARRAPPSIRPGLGGERRAIVTESMVTTHAGGARGGVLTTPSMIMLMEETAQEITRPCLPADHTTVGFEILVRHLAPALLGAEITVTAELIQVDDRKLLFDVSAYDGRRKIGEGTLRRTIVRLGALEDRERGSGSPPDPPAGSPSTAGC